jgi:signal transduction histidine kinase
VFPALPDSALDLVRNVFETGEPIVGLESSTTTPAHPDEPRHFLASLHPIRRPHARTEAVGIIVVDMTDQKKTEVRLREDASLRERFIGILSHDIRNPIAAILMTASTLLEAAHLAEDAVHGLRRIAASAERMDRMVRDLLDLTRSRHGTEIPMRRRPTDLGAVSREVIDEIAASAGSDRIRLETLSDCTGQWDPDRLAQVVGNLVSNALHYSPAGTPVLVKVNGTEAEDVQLSVNNQGAPIPEDARPLLFDPYRRGAERTGPREGLGLGLFITAQIAHAHHGTIEVHSTLDDGTTFTVTLPRDRPIT